MAAATRTTTPEVHRSGDRAAPVNGLPPCKGARDELVVRRGRI